MSGASRSRLLELRALLESATRARDVLERKRELLLYELRLSRARAGEERRRVLPALAAARATLVASRVELGGAALDAAAFGQGEDAAVELRVGSLVGTPVPRLVARSVPFRPVYGPVGTAASLDAAGAAFAALLPGLARLAELEATTLALHHGLRKTARRLRALERVVIPAYQADLKAVLGGLEDEERDEAVRRRSWLLAKESAPSSARATKPASSTPSRAEPRVPEEGPPARTR